MTNRIYAAISLTTGIILLIASIATYIKIHKGSKSNFAYVLTMFVTVSGLANIAYFMIYKITHNVTADNQTISYRNFYCRMIQESILYLVFLQTWVFSMKYLQSANQCIKNGKPQQINTVMYIIVIVYVLVIIEQLVRCLVEFPGYVNNNSFSEFNTWYYTKQYSIWIQDQFISLGLVVISIVIQIVALRLIYSVVQQVTRVNIHSMMVHSAALIIQAAVLAISITPQNWFSMADTYMVIQQVSLILDALVQLIICYICWTMGSSAKLRNWHVVIVQDEQGSFTFEFLPTLDNEDSSIFETQSVQSTLQIEQQQLQRSGHNLEQECDIIVQQFIDSLESTCSEFLLDNE